MDASLDTGLSWSTYLTIPTGHVSHGERPRHHPEATQGCISLEVSGMETALRQPNEQERLKRDPGESTVPLGCGTSGPLRTDRMGNDDAVTTVQLHDTNHIHR